MSLSLARWLASLASMRLCGEREAGASRLSTGGEFGRYGWVRSGGVMQLSHGFSVRVVSAPVRYIGLSSWVWVKSDLGVENYLSAVLKSSCMCTIFSINASISGLFSKLAGEFLRNFE